MKKPLFLIPLLATLLIGCQGDQTHLPAKKRPLVPPAQETSPLHPWMELQSSGVEATPYIQADLQTFSHLEEQLGAKALIETIDSLQNPIMQRLGVTPPTHWYRVFSLPETPVSVPPHPLPYRIVARYLVDETETGMPFFLEIRDYGPLTQPQKKALASWLKSTLTPSLLEVSHPRFTLFQGTGDHQLSLYNPSHGLSPQNRALFAALYSDQEGTLLLFADAPAPLFKKHSEDFSRLLGN